MTVAAILAAEKGSRCNACANSSLYAALIAGKNVTGNGKTPPIAVSQETCCRSE